MHLAAIALLLAGTAWQTHYERGKSRLEAGDARAAVVSLRKAAKLAPREAVVWYQLSRALRRTGRAQEAHAAAERYKILEGERRKNEPVGTMAAENDE